MSVVRRSLLLEGCNRFLRTFAARVRVVFKNPRNRPFGNSAHANPQVSAGIKYVEVKNDWPVKRPPRSKKARTLSGAVKGGRNAIGIATLKIEISDIRPLDTRNLI